MNSIFDYPDRICLNGMSFYGHTGVLDFEKQNGQDFLVDLTLCFGNLHAVKTDDLAQTVDYGEVFALVKRIVEAGHFNLIEHLAGVITVSVFEQFPLVEAAETVVVKPDAPVDGIFESMSVCIFRERAAFKEVEVKKI